MRNLDITILRSFVTVVESGGVTRASGLLNLTQSAVSMQIKRLEELLDAQLLDRSNRQISLTPEGEQVLGYARKMVEMNDVIFSRLTDQVFEGELILGVPHDIVYPFIPQVLSKFNAEFPRMRVQLQASHTVLLKKQFARGECELILTTEYDLGENGETLSTLPLRWVGAPGGNAWKKRPLHIAFGQKCRFRQIGLQKLEDAGIAWESAVESASDRTIEATISADLAVGAMLEGTEPPQLELIQHNGALPDLSVQDINMYLAPSANMVTTRLADLIRLAYAASAPTRLKAVG